MKCRRTLVKMRLGLFAFLGTALIVMLLDQASKLYIIWNFNPGDSVSLVPGVFHLTYVRNPGAAFGILAHKTTFFIVISAIMILLIFFGRRFFSTRRIGIHLAFALQMGGALGNLIDRVRFGYVIDFLDFQVWPVFNIADVAIVAGMILLLFNLAREASFFQDQKG